MPSGNVEQVSFHPAANQLWLQVNDRSEVILFEEGTELRCNGCTITPKELVSWLFQNQATVTLYPRLDRHSASTKAEFVQKN